MNTGIFTDPTLDEGAKASMAWQVEALGPTFVDETAAFNEVGDADLEPFPAGVAVGDYFAVGYTSPFDKLIFDDANGTQGVGGTVDWEYWDGAAWTAVSGLADGTAGFTAALADGKEVTWTMPPDWAPTVLDTSAAVYFVRARVTGAYATNPVLDQGYIGRKLVVSAYEKAGQVSRASISANYLVTLL